MLKNSFSNKIISAEDVVQPENVDNYHGCDNLDDEACKVITLRGDDPCYVPKGT